MTIVSCFDPNDEQDMETKAQHKGKRYCFIAAIIDDNQSPAVMAIPDNLRPDADKAGFMHETLDIFEGGKKQTADYHGMFDSAYFIKWMEKLLQALAHQNVEKALIVMDNAKYHKSLPNGTPKGSWRKQQLVDYCVEHGIAISPADLKSVIWDRLKKHIEANVQPVIVAMAEAAGHQVVWSHRTIPTYNQLSSSGQMLKGMLVDNIPQTQPSKMSLFDCRRPLLN